MSWEIKAKKQLLDSLKKKMELNELDWKAKLPGNKKIAQHISAFANYSGGGVLAIGVDDAGNLLYKKGADPFFRDQIEKITNIARDMLDPTVRLDYTIISINAHDVLLVHIKESSSKPVCIQGDINESYIRSGGSTRKMDRSEIQEAFRTSLSDQYELGHALSQCTEKQVLSMLDYQHFFQALRLPIPSNSAAILRRLEYEEIIERHSDKTFSITNLGALLLANSLDEFPALRSHHVRIIQYQGNNNQSTVKEIQIKQGYAMSLGLILNQMKWIVPNSEVYVNGKRETIEYPLLVMREAIVNALIHQDLGQLNADIKIEIYSSRIEISNPGRPLIDPNRFVDHPSKTRNKLLAQKLRILGLCEEHGKGCDEMIRLLETVRLPAPKFEAGDNYTRVTLFFPKKFEEMTVKERIENTYWHACIMHVEGKKMTNTTLRERFDVPEKNRQAISRIISKSIENGMIKDGTTPNQKKSAFYLPYWA